MGEADGDVVNLVEKLLLVGKRDGAVEEDFISSNARQIIVSAPKAIELVEKLEEYVPCYKRVASKLNWETEQQLGYPQAQEIGR
ncbi:hypothetical protein BC332_31193 [Capsicum chinense]|nr:hypothetical protein BC332_31193 [Capsicum chinense]